jgi:hypothetical protein
METKPDIEIVDEQTVQTLAYRQRVTLARYAFILAALLLLPWAILAMAVLFLAFLWGSEAPNWAVALESSIVTGSLAVIFKDYLPSIAPRRR